MRWKNENLKVGQTRVIVRFLLFPTKIGNEWRWLEFARINQMAVGYSLIGEPAHDLKWMDESWAT